MSNRFIMFSLMWLIIPAMVFAGTFFENEKKTNDVYIADRGNFNSLFVNPAGVAGESGFDFSISMGSQGKINSLRLIGGVSDIVYGFSTGEFDKASMIAVNRTFADLYKSGVINASFFEGLYTGTDFFGADGIPDNDDDPEIDWSDLESLQEIIESEDFDTDDITAIAVNMKGVLEGNNTSFYEGIPEEVSFSILAGFKTGFLIKGWGMGIYDQAMSVVYMNPDLQAFGLQVIYNELGAIVGGGFAMLDGRFSLGFTGNYSTLLLVPPVNFVEFETLLESSINIGFSWGLDIGAIWRPIPSVGLGIVFNDVAGYTEAGAPHTLNGFKGVLDGSVFLIKDFDYKFTLDMDAGVSWQPDWSFTTPKLSFDMYNVIGYFRDSLAAKDDFSSAMYRTMEHMRFGVNFTFFDFLMVGGQYYNHCLSTGVGFDLLFFELYGEFKIHDDAFKAKDFRSAPIGGDISMRLHF